MLKAQINPHFIFNSLNNIYSLAYSKSDQTPEAVLKLSPMFFIPFVENSFKYSKIEDQDDARVEIKLTTSGKELSFKIVNTHPENGHSPGSGVGIENVRSRLELTYPEKHELKVRDENNLFEVEMKIKQS